MNPRFHILIFATALVLAATGCPKSQQASSSKDEATVEKRETDDARAEPEAGEESRYERLREAMVDQQIARRDIDDPRVIAAMREVPRHLFMPEEMRDRAYIDSPAPIGHGQTISQPFIVASMTEQLQIDSGDKVLEIGTGSGYQAAVLAEIGVELYTIEVVCDLAESARKALEAAGYEDVVVKCGNGYKGWPEHAPFDKIIVTAAPPEVPQALVEQLAKGGRMIIPVGEASQDLWLITKDGAGEVHKKTLYGVRFVPMVDRDPDAGQN